MIKMVFWLIAALFAAMVMIVPIYAVAYVIGGK